MKKVLLKDRQTVVDVYDLLKNDELNDSLVCTDCKISVTFVNPSKKSPHFRAHKNHRDNCSYNGWGIAENIANESEGIVYQLSKEEFIVDIDKVQLLVKEYKEGKTRSKNAEKEIRQIYFRTISSILRLKKVIESEFEGGKIFSNAIKIKVGNKVIAWNDFYYEEDAKRLNKCFGRDAKHVGDTVCLEGEYLVNEIRGEICLTLKDPWVEAKKDGYKYIPSVRFTFQDPALAANIKELIGDKKKRATILLDIECYLSPLQKSLYYYQNITGNIYNSKQIHFHN